MEMKKDTELKHVEIKEVNGQTQEAASKFDLKNRTVLIVDDDKDALEEMVDTLRDYNLNVLPATDANEAIILAKQHEPAYVIMDFNLPKTNGLDAVTAMRKFLPETTYIMISGNQEFCQVATTSNTKVFAILQKPISMDGISRFIKTSLETAYKNPVDITSMVWG
jgi:DNA-binding NtrC family response regulator